MLNVFEMVSSKIKDNVLNNRGYGDIGKEITDDEIKNGLDLDTEGSCIYDDIKSNDKLRLMGMFNQVKQTKLNENQQSVCGIDNNSKPIQIL